MTITLFLERISLLSALTVIVLAVFWPHVKPRLLEFSKFFLSIIYYYSHNDDYQSKYPNNRIKLPNLENPKLSGRKLNRISSSKGMPLKSIYKSVGGFGQSQLNPKLEPSFTSDGSLFPSSSSEQLDHLIRNQQRPGLSANYHHQQQQSSTLLSIYTACIVALIIYTMMKALGARFNNNPGYGANRSSYHSSRSNREERDIRSTLDKRKLIRMSREERIRELMKQHGGKNVSSAVKFLATELEKQKRILLKNLTESDGKICSCRCHFIDNPSDININSEEDFSSCKKMNHHIIDSNTSNSDIDKTGG